LRPLEDRDRILEAILSNICVSHGSRKSGVVLVYCVKCGAKNPDDAAICAQCGNSLAGVERGRTKEEKAACFGMPSHWGGILLGVFIVILGLFSFYQQFAHVSWDVFGPLVLIFIGIAVLLGGFYRYSRR
jgi:ribosomal protein L40E